MFSGIVEEMGAVSVLNKGLAGTRLTIIASTIMSDLTIGASVSVNGTCLTAKDSGASGGSAGGSGCGTNARTGSPSVVEVMVVPVLRMG